MRGQAAANDAGSLPAHTLEEPMRRVLAITTAGVLALTLAACGSSSKGGGNGKSGGNSSGNYVDGKTFTFVLPSDPGSLDPQFTSLSVTYQVDMFLYDSLISLDPNNKEVAGLASKWSGTPTSATYTLHKGVTCSDGTPLTATDIANNINFVGNPANKSSRIGVFVPPGATAKGDDTTGTVTVTSKSPDPFLVRDVGGLQIVCPKGMQNRNLLKQGADGTGPYTVTQAVANDHYTLTLRKGYTWGPGGSTANAKGLPAQVVLKVVSNETTAANLLLSGAVNAAQIVGPDRQRLTAQQVFHRDFYSTFGELWYNEKPGQATANEAVRRALTQALDLSQLRKVLTSGTGSAPTGLIPSDLNPCGGNTVSGNLPTTDVAAAKSALAGKVSAMTFFYPSSYGATMESTAELLQQAWSAVGVKVTLKGVTDAQINQEVVGGQGSWNAALIPFGVPEPSQIVPFVSGPTAPNGTNFADIQNPTYTQHVQKASAQAGTAGCPDWQAAEEALFQRVDVVPFANTATPVFGKGATFELMQGAVIPTSVRMLG